MRTLLISYDLHVQGQKYTELIDYIESYGTYWRNLGSTSLIKTDKTAAEVCAELRQLGLIDDNDKVLVIEVTNQSAAWYGFSSKGSEWIKGNL